MASPISPPGSVRRGGRYLPRRSTKGPLDSAEDPLTAAPSEQNTVSPIQSVQSDNDNLIQSSIVTLPEPALETPHPKLAFDLRFLQDRRRYHTIPKDEIPQAFLESTQQPPANASLQELLKHGHFRRAAEAALDELVRADAHDASHMLQLLYCRLACLMLIVRPELAADEALPLLDFLSSSDQDGKLSMLAPWQLRILIVRLQSVSAQDGGRRAIMGMYGLASEVRAHIRQARETESHDTVHLWGERLHDLGLRVVDTLVEMGELETASRQLDSLTHTNQDEVLLRKVLLRVRLGDIDGAERLIGDLDSPTSRSICQALLQIAGPDTRKASSAWHEMAPTSELAQQNEAVYLLYSGRIEEGVQLLESLAQRGTAFQTLLYNLSTMYELCGEQAQSKKLSLAEQLAAGRPQSTSGGWERTTLDLKL